MKKLKSFYDFLNSLNADSNFIMEVGGKIIFFLDLKISIINGQLETIVYSKITDSHLYLHEKSCHKASVKENVVLAIILWIKEHPSNVLLLE